MREIFCAEHAELKKVSSGKAYRPSNGMEGELFVAAWCDACSKNGPCEIIGRSMIHEVQDPGYPMELRIRPDGQPECRAFVPAIEERVATAEPEEADSMSQVSLMTVAEQFQDFKRDVRPDFGISDLEVEMLFYAGVMSLMSQLVELTRRAMAQPASDDYQNRFSAMREELQAWHQVLPERMARQFRDMPNSN